MRSTTLGSADDAFDGGAWDVAAAAYAQADSEAPLPPAALERWGLAAYLAGRDEQSDAARERAYHGYLAAGELEAAARVGHWLGVTLVLRGEPARGGGWFGRVQSLLDEHGLHDSPWQLYLQVSYAMRALFSGDAVTAAARFEQLVDAAAAFDAPDLHILARNGLGQSLVALGRVGEGLQRLDEVMVAVTSTPAVSPHVVGLMYCAVIDTCRRCFDHDRALEWTRALTRWCARQPGLVPYRGQCLVHRAEVLQLHGLWGDAREEVERVFRQLGEDPTDPAAGMAHYQRGELSRMRGEQQSAELAYRKAARCGRDPQPGLALLRVAQGDVASGWAAIQRAVDESGMPDRLRLLPAFVEIALAAAELDAASAAAGELQAAAVERDVPWLAAVAAHARGQVALARGDGAAALGPLREALGHWQRLAAPHDVAVTRVHIAAACRLRGDDESAELELDAARWTFAQLGATPGLARVDAASRRPAPRAAPGGLTPREAQVLRLVATGATNRAVAAELFVSEKTVARHVANIFLKLGVSSRAAATSFAYAHRLV